MSNKVFLIDYGIYFTDGKYESHTMKVKNCMSEIHSKVKLEDYLKKKHSNFQRLVIYKCVDDIFGIFSMMGNANPFM
jgi:hypothetical protein